jgi:hypothetical protein
MKLNVVLFLVPCSLVALAGCGNVVAGDPSSSSSSGTTTTSGAGGGGGADTTSSAATTSGGTGGSACVPVDDGNACTVDVCENGVAVNKPVPAGNPCSIGGTMCDGMGACVATPCNGTFGFALPPAGGPQTLVGFGAYASVATDLNGDGKPDLAVVNYQDSNVSVLFGAGDGTLAPAVSYATGENPLGIVAIDLNGDGKLDLVVADSPLNAVPAVGDVSVLLNLGNGTFAPRVQFPAGGFVMAISAGDLDGDGKADVVVANAFDNSVSVLMNKGDGTLAAPVAYATGEFSRDVVVQDFDGDGKADVAVANQSTNNVGVLLNKGNGTLAPLVSYTVSSGPAWILAADLNGDGKADLVSSSTSKFGGGGPIDVMLNLGNGTFGPPTNYVNPGKSGPVLAKDLDGDGKLDLFSMIFGSIHVFLNQGGGTFAPLMSFPTGDMAVGSSPIAAVDLSSDGRPDLVFANNSSGLVSVLLNTCAP